MTKYKSKIITAIFILAALAAAWFFGSPPEVNVPGAYTPPVLAATEAPAPPSVTVAERVYTEETQDDFPEEPEEEPKPYIEEQDIQIVGIERPEAREPEEPEDIVISDDSFTVTLSVSAHTIVYNMHLLHTDMHELIPPGGIIFPPTVVTAYKGESVFNVLQREMRRNRIHMASRWTPIFNSAYVEAINNIFEFDVGPLSGWMYNVNGWFPNFGSSRYLLSPGDVIEWVYTLDLGRDLGVYWVEGNLSDFYE